MSTKDLFILKLTFNIYLLFYYADDDGGDDDGDDDGTIVFLDGDAINLSIFIIINKSKVWKL